MKIAAHFCRAQKISFIFDPGQQICVLQKSDFFEIAQKSFVSIFNEFEWKTARENFLKNESEIFELCENLIITRGENGAEIRCKNSSPEKISAKKVSKVIDATGAGDAFRAGILFGMAHNWPLKKSCELGAKIAAEAVQSFGTQNFSFKIDS